MGGKGDAPPPPDYAAAAQATAKGDLEATKYAVQANRPTMITPWGTSTWKDDGNNNWTNTVSLTADQQAALDSQAKIQKNQSQLADTMQGQVANSLKNGIATPSVDDFTKNTGQINTNYGGFDPSGAGKVNQNTPQFTDQYQQQAIDAAYSRSTNLAQKQWDQENKSLDEKLRLQGLQPGSEAYNLAMKNQLDSQNEARTQLSSQAVLTGNQIANQNYQSQLAGFQTGNDAQGQAYEQSMKGYLAGQDAITNTNAAQAQAYAQAMNRYQASYQDAINKYLTPLNAMQGLLNGQQVQSPQFQGFAQQATTKGADMLGAAGAQYQAALGGYNAKQAANAQTMQAATQLGGAAMMAFM